jgi:endonuclease/exonuclease/phosphatase (EEP) superfamily protein YafD
MLNRSIQLPSILNRSLVYLSCGAIVGLTVLSLLKYLAWHPYLELTAHFTVQYLLASALLGTLVGLLTRKRGLWIVLFCIAIQLGEVLPWYLPPAWANAPATHNVRVMLSNLYVRNQNPAKILALVRTEKPDILVVQETSAAWRTALAPLKAQWPYVFAAPDDIAIYSRIPLTNSQLFGPPEQVSLATTVTIDQQKVVLVATHPFPPKPNLTPARNAELDRVANYIRQVNPRQTPVILIGDLNTSLWSPYYKRLEQKTGLKNTRQGFGTLPTWPAPTRFASTYPLLAFFKPILWIPIDHCLVSPTIQVRSVRIGPNIDSDHLPLIADLFIPRGGG